MTEIRNFRLKITFYIHFILIVWVTIGRWCPQSYLFYNVILTVLLLWGLHSHDSEEPIQLAILINGTSILFDIILLALRYPDGHSGSGEHFSAAMAILNLVLRPFTSIVLYRVLQERNGSLGPLEGVASMFGNSRAPGSYEDMDRHQSVPTTSQEEHDFYQPQKI